LLSHVRTVSYSRLQVQGLHHCGLSCSNALLPTKSIIVVDPTPGTPPIICGVVLDSVGSVDHDRRPFGIPRLCSHSGCIGSGSMSWPSVRFGPHKIKIIKSIRSHSGGPLGTILTTHSWELKSFNALPLRRTTWYCCSYHSLLGFARFPRHRRPVLVGSRYLGISSRGLVLSVLPTPTDLYHSHVVPVAGCNYHGPFVPLLIHSFHSSRGLLSTRLDSHGLLMVFPHVACCPLDCWTPTDYIRSYYSRGPLSVLPTPTDSSC
jgi:hypothetical protein